MVRKALAMLAVAVAAFWAVALLQPTPVDATSHRAVRSFSAPWVLPDGRLEVTIAPTGYGSIGQVVETLPAGFSYSGSDLSESQVAANGQTVTFTLLGEETFAYTVTAPAAGGSYEFSGIIKDEDKAEASVVGASSIRVGSPPTPTPTFTPTPTTTPTTAPTPTSTPTPTLTPVPSPTPTHTPAPTTTPERRTTATLVPAAAPTATPEPTAAAAPEPTPEPTAAATPEPTAEPAATLEPTASPTPQTMLVVEPTATPAPTATVVVAAAGDGPPGILWFIPVVVLLVLVLAVFFYLRTRR